MIDRRFSFVPALAVLLFAACSEEAETPVETEQAATATGDILGGSISDDMLPLEELRSQSPPAPRATTSRTSVVSVTEEGETVVETTVTSTTGEPGPPPPEPPAPPAENPGS